MAQQIWRITFHLNPILQFSSQMQRSGTLYWVTVSNFLLVKKLHYSIFAHSSVQEICIFSREYVTPKMQAI